MLGWFYMIRPYQIRPDSGNWASNACLRCMIHGAIVHELWSSQPKQDWILIMLNRSWPDTARDTVYETCHDIARKSKFQTATSQSRFSSVGINYCSQLRGNTSSIIPPPSISGPPSNQPWYPNLTQPIAIHDNFTRIPIPPHPTDINLTLVYSTPDTPRAECPGR